MKCCLQKDFFKHTPGKKRKEDSMSSQKKKGMNLERKTESYRLGFPDAGNDPDRMDELLSDDSGIYPVFADRYGH